MNNCLHCGRKTDRPKFCCNKHKDKYHNRTNPRGIYAHLADKNDDPLVCQMRDAEATEWDHGENGIY